MRGKKPFVERNVAALHDGAGANGELVAALVAKEHAFLRLAAHLADGERTTMRTHRLAIPALRFDVSGGLGFIVKDRVGDVDVHRTLYVRNGLLSKVYNCQRDHEAFSSYIDFQGVRASLREEIAAQAAIQAAESNDEYEQLGAMLGEAIVGPAIERLVSPVTVRVAFERAAASSEEAPDLKFFSEVEHDANVERSGFNKFRAAISNGGKLVFSREWLSWKLTGVEFPVDTVDRGDTEIASAAETVEGDTVQQAANDEPTIDDPLPDEPLGHGGLIHREQLQADCNEGDDFACEMLGEMAPEEVWYQM